MWARSINSNKNGDIATLENDENATFLSKYITIPKEINESSIDLRECNDSNNYKTTMVADSNIVGGDYNITCKD